MDLLARGEIVQLEPTIWCGPQPTDDEWLTLSQHKLEYANSKNIVVKLNTTEAGDGDDTDTSIAARLYDFEIAHCPIRPIETWLEETPVDEIEKAINIIFTAYQNGWFCYFHCKNGRDRTGEVRYGFRLACGWSEEAASDEAERLGFRGGVIHPRLQDLYDRLKSTNSA